MPATTSAPATGSAAARLEAALDLLCGALVALDIISLLPAQPEEPGRAETLTSQVGGCLRRAIAEIRLARDETQNRLVAGFILESDVEP